MGLAVLGMMGLTAEWAPRRCDRVSARLGMLFAALAAVLGAILAFGIWSLWPIEADPARLGWGLAILLPAAVIASFGFGFALGRTVERRLEALAEDRPAAGTSDILGLGKALDVLAGRFDEILRETDRRSRARVSNTERIAQLGSAERNLITGKGMWSDEFHAILGIVPGSCVPTPEIFLEVVHPGDREEVAAVLRDVMSGGSRRETDFRIVRPDGEVRMLHGSAEVARDAAGTPIRLDSTIQDITERKRLENELDGLIRELWRSNEELEQFAYVASHDLRQPLRVVGSYVSLLEEELMGSLTGDSLEYMGFVRDGVRRMDRLITDLLTYSRVGRVGGNVPVNVDDAIRSALADLQIEIEDCLGRVEVRGDLPVLYGDQGEMERLFLNLVGNAIKYYQPERPPVVTVSCDDMNSHWLFKVADNGIGIPAEHAERVFGIFQRLHARDEYEGTGVGLAICKKIVERHGGTIKVEASEGPGTVLAFTWPKAPPPTETES
ncbi:MAG: PAS domain-containing protein [Magnetospirillum sp.]|nr:PAS domain-containing protein [Magnetospirillum sp.]